MFILSITLEIPSHDRKHRIWIDKTLNEVVEELTTNPLEACKFPLFKVGGRTEVAGQVTIKDVPEGKKKSRKKRVLV